jgi:hypothetical protein
MKRSEMVKLITDKLFYGKLAEKARLTGVMITDLAEKDAEEVLKELEKLGMLPPLRSATYRDKFWNETICAEMDGMDVKVALWDREESDRQKRKRNNE